MRIAFVTFEYPPFIMGGAGIYAFNVTHELAKLGHQVVVFTPDVLESASRSDLSSLKIQKVPINKKLPFKALQFWLNLPNEVKKSEKDSRFDIVHLNGISYWFLKKRLSKAKHIVTVHHLVKDAVKNNNLSFISKLKDISGENSLFMPLLEKKCIKSPDKIVAISNFTKRQIIDSYNIDPNRIEVIYNGVSLNGYSCSEDKMADFTQQLPLTKKPIILFVGRVDDPRKGLIFLLQSVKRVLYSIDVTLIVVGKGDQTKAKKLIGLLGISNNVVFTGYVNENLLLKYYSLCDIYVCSSKLEGFGLTLVEAMAAGKPIVATKVGAIPEIVEDNINGILVEPCDIMSMSNAIISLIQNKNLAINIGKINAEYIKNNFSWIKCAKKLEELYSFNI